MDAYELWDWAMDFFVLSGGVAIISTSIIAVVFVLNYMGVI